jgi:hypothetical protein
MSREELIETLSLYCISERSGNFWLPSFESRDAYKCNQYRAYSLLRSEPIGMTEDELLRIMVAACGQDTDRERRVKAYLFPECRRYMAGDLHPSKNDKQQLQKSKPARADSEATAPPVVPLHGTVIQAPRPVHAASLADAGPSAPQSSATTRRAPHEPKHKRPFFTSANQFATLPLDDEDIPTEPELPKERWDAFSHLVHQKIAGYTVASAPERQKIFSEFLNIPKYFCKKLTVSADSRHRRQFTSRQLAGEVMEVEARDTSVGDPDLAFQRCKRKVFSLLTRGKVGKACRALMEKPSLPLSFKDGHAALEALHPYESPSDLSISTAGPSFQRLEPDDFMRAIRKCCSGAAPGRTGWTEELILCIASNPCTGVDLAAMTLDVINNNVAADTRERLTQCRLIALAKPPKVPGGPPGVRPIAIGEALLKVAATIVLMSETQAVSRYFDGLQYGVGCPGGAEIASHRIAQGVRTRKITVALDAANAFNTPLRSEIAKTLRAETKFRSFYNLWNLAYAEPSNLHYRNHGEEAVILSQRGTRQGDVLGGFFFALAIHPILRDAKSSFTEIDIYAYLDDITLQGDDGPRMTECITFIRDRMASLGMSLNASKCEWYSVSLDCPFPTWEHRKDGIKILGVFHGHQTFVQSELVKHFHKRHTDFFSNLAKLRGTAAAVLLSACGMPRMNYVIRTHPPGPCEEVCGIFDQHVIDAWSRIAEVDATDRITQDIAHLPCSLGGCGFTRTRDIRHFAYQASHEFAINTAGPSQAQLVLTYMMTVYEALCNSNKTVALHLDDCKQPGTADWFRTMKDMPIHLTAAEASAALRIRLNAVHKDLSTYDRIQCPGCRIDLAKYETNSHFRGCVHIAGDNVSQAHAGFKSDIGRLCSRRSITHESHEPAGYDMYHCGGCGKFVDAELVEVHATESPGCDIAALKTSHKIRPDKRIYFATGPVLTDESLVAVACRSISRSATSSATSALDARTTKKINMYGEAVRKHGEEFMVICATPNGSFGMHTWDLIHRIIKHSGLPGDSIALIARELRVGIAGKSGRALLNAERKTSNVVHAIHRLARPTLPTSMASTSHAAIVTAIGKQTVTTCRSESNNSDTLLTDSAPSAVPRQTATPHDETTQSRKCISHMTTLFNGFNAEWSQFATAQAKGFLGKPYTSVRSDAFASVAFCCLQEYSQKADAFVGQYAAVILRTMAYNVAPGDTFQQIADLVENAYRAEAGTVAPRVPESAPTVPTQPAASKWRNSVRLDAPSLGSSRPFPTVHGGAPVGGTEIRTTAVEATAVELDPE